MGSGIINIEGSSPSVESLVRLRLPVADRVRAHAVDVGRQLVRIDRLEVVDAVDAGVFQLLGGLLADPFDGLELRALLPGGELPVVADGTAELPRLVAGVDPEVRKAVLLADFVGDLDLTAPGSGSE